MVEKIGAIKGVFEVKELFENPNKYGDVISHISFRYNYIDRWNYFKGRIVFTYKNRQLFIPDKGYLVLKKLDTFKIIEEIKNHYKLLGKTIKK